MNMLSKKQAEKLKELARQDKLILALAKMERYGYAMPQVMRTLQKWEAQRQKHIRRKTKFSDRENSLRTHDRDAARMDILNLAHSIAK